MYSTNKLSMQGPSNDSHLIAVPGPSSSQFIKKDPHERGEQVMTMIIDPSHLYQHNPPQKMYRLVSSDVDLNGHPMHHVIPSGSPPRKKKVTGAGICPPTSQHLPQRSQLSDEILIDELGETLVIEQGRVEQAGFFNRDFLRRSNDARANTCDQWRRNYASSSQCSSTTSCCPTNTWKCKTFFRANKLEKKVFIKNR